MKKLLLIAAIIAALFIPHLLWAVTPGTAPQSVVWDASGTTVQVTFVCTGSVDDGSIPNTAIASATMTKLLNKYYLYSATAYHTPGGTAPDAADVSINMNGMDLLGGKGANLIHASATYDTLPYSAFMSAYRYPAITNTVTLSVANEITASANYTIELIFSR
jgi:hypothetical protein